MSYVGYVVNNYMSMRLKESVRTELKISNDETFVLVSLGGGKGTGNILLSIIKSAHLLSKFKSMRWLIVGGPLISNSEMQQLREAVGNDSSIRLIQYWPNLIELLRASDLFIGCSGYNTSAEIIKTGVRAILIPRSHLGDAEQTLRAQLLSKKGLCKILELETGFEKNLVPMIESYLVEPKLSNQKEIYNVNGAEVVANTVEELFTGYDSLNNQGI